VPADQKTSVLKEKFLTSRDLAKAFKCSERTAREMCKRGKIKAIQTPGGHWRVPAELAPEMQSFLQKKRRKLLVRRRKEVEGDSLDADIACWLMEASLTGQTLEEFVPEPHWSEVEPIEPPNAAPTNEQLRVKRVEGLIWKTLRDGDSFSHLVLKGWVYQFWLKEQNSRCPTVKEIAALMGVSRRTFYRRGYKTRHIKDLHGEACEPVRDHPRYSNARGTIFEYGESSRNERCSIDDDLDDGYDGRF
jgi:excisionase family DNA binding protein